MIRKVILFIALGLVSLSLFMACAKESPETKIEIPFGEYVLSGGTASIIYTTDDITFKDCDTSFIIENFADELGYANLTEESFIELFQKPYKYQIGDDASPNGEVIPEINVNIFGENWQEGYATIGIFITYNPDDMSLDFMNESYYIKGN